MAPVLSYFEMMKFEVACGFSPEKNNLEKAVKEASVQIKSRLSSPRIDLCIVFFNLSVKNNTLHYEIRRTLNPKALIGTSSPYLIFENTVSRYGLIIVALTGIECHTQMVENIEEKSWEHIESELSKTIHSETRTRRDLGLVFFHGKMKYPQSLLKGFQRSMGRMFPLLGISSVPKNEFISSASVDTQQLSATAIARNSLVYANFNTENFRYGFALLHGFKPIGRPSLITEKENNIIKTIEKIPANRFYLSYFDKSTLVQKETSLKKIAGLYPLGIETQEGMEPLLRPPTETTKDGSLEVIGDIPFLTARMMIATRQSLIHAAQKSLRTSLRPVKKPLCAIIFESFTRFKMLGSQYRNELSLIKSDLGKIPLVGALSNYQIAPLYSSELGGEARIHHSTVCVLTLGER